MHAKRKTSDQHRAAPPPDEIDVPQHFERGGNVKRRAKLKAQFDRALLEKAREMGLPVPETGNDPSKN